jgi:hypothetical protein
MRGPMDRCDFRFSAMVRFGAQILGNKEGGPNGVEYR